MVAGDRIKSQAYGRKFHHRINGRICASSFNVDSKRVHHGHSMNFGGR